MQSVASKTITQAPPAHIAVIMDGNGRWAKARGLPKIAGHQRGAESARRVVRGCLERGVQYLTLYAFSSENWKRPADEVQDLMALLQMYLKRELNELAKNGVRLRVIGDRGGLTQEIRNLIDAAELRTIGNSQLNLTVALNYGARNEIVDATRKIAAAVRDGDLDPSAIDEALFSDYLETVSLPDPDVIIRTSGECRLSNFLLWQSAYSELIFTPTLWPDFGDGDLEAAIDDFHKRDRRYGGTGG